MTDFTSIKGEIDPSSYGAGVHHVKVGAWEFKQSKNGKDYLEMAWEKDGFHGKDGRPFTSSRLYFSSEKAVQIARGKLHKLCDLLGVTYSEEKMANCETIVALGEEMLGKELDIELVPTGGKNDKGNDYLGVRIKGVGDFFIPVKEDDPFATVSEPSPRLEDMDSDVPF